MMMLGRYRFSIETAAYQTLRRTTQYRWPQHNRFGQRPSRQWAGMGDDTVSLEGLIYPGCQGGPSQMDAMRAEAERGEPLVLMDGRGYDRGLWVILSIRDGREQFFGDGRARKINFTLELGHYGNELARAG